MNCPDCHAQLTPGSRYCVFCGASVAPETVAAAGKPNPYEAPSAWDDPHFAPEMAYRTFAPTTSGMAIVSLVAGILAWFAIPGIGALVAVITGHLARVEVRDSGGRIIGDDLAKAGMVLGYVQIGLVVAVVGIIVLIVTVGVVFAHR